jgi:AcrR family transcriptional regulator
MTLSIHLWVPKVGRRETKTDLTKQQMLAAAAELFLERGYENTRIDDVAERANVAKGTFYYHFESKEALVVALRRSKLADTVEQSFALLESGGMPLVALEKLLLERSAFTEREPDLSKVFYTEKIGQLFFKDEDVQIRLDENGQPKKRTFRRAVYELVCEAQKQGQVRADLSPQELSAMIVACFLHAQGSWLSSDRTASLVEKVHRWIHALLDGIGVKAYRDQATCFALHAGTDAVR